MGVRSTKVGPLVAVVCCSWFFAISALAQDHEELMEITFRPVDYAQIALWVEDDTGNLIKTLRLTEATASRGIGNRPGASQMNSGFRWPYGRREGVLPIWATRRATAPGAQKFRRVIFQNRLSEGRASRTSDDYSKDDYFCLSFQKERSSKDALDAVSCATVFSSDKGRYITEDDIASGYGEPFEDPETGQGILLPLEYESLYPPRRDVAPCIDCFEHPDVASFGSHAREVMPEIDAVTMATPKGDRERTELFPVPKDWEPGTYRLCLEINVEGDYNEVYNDATFPTPVTPSGLWDEYWAVRYGYAYRGQPSVLYCTDFDVGSGEDTRTFGTDKPEGSAGTWDHRRDDFGQLHDMSGMTDDPVNKPGAGADRLQVLSSGDRLQVKIQPGSQCADAPRPTMITDLEVSPHGDMLHAHEWALMEFEPVLGERGVHRYDVRVSIAPIVDEQTFMEAQPAKEATVQAEELTVPTTANGPIEVAMGGLSAEQHYYIAVQAVDDCAARGPIAVAEFDTPERQFTTVTPCFVATAAYGSPLAAEVGSLRRFRDRHLLNHPLGKELVDVYYRVGPTLAQSVRKDGALRSVVRAMLQPVVRLASWLTD